MKVRLTLIIGLALLSLAGCGGDESSAATLKGPIDYSKSGGFAGVDEKLTIQPDGNAKSASRTKKRSFRLSAKQQRELTAAVSAADLENAKSPKAGNGADAFYYSIRYRGHRVAWSDLTKSPPEKVQKLYSLLGRLYEAHPPR